MKVLSFNVGYFLGFRSQRAWLRRPHRLLWGDRRVESAGMDAVVALVESTEPDVIALQEVDQGSFRSGYRNQATELSSRLDRPYDHRIDNKYDPDTLAGGLPVLRHMSNMVCWQSGTAHARYLSAGMKRLVQVVERDVGPNVVAVHLSKTRGTRSTQFEELADIVASFRPAVVAGDFNVKDPDEFERFTDATGLSLQIPGKSFSTTHPTYPYDVFLTPPELAIERCAVVPDVECSDHRPVVLELA